MRLKKCKKRGFTQREFTPTTPLFKMGQWRKFAFAIAASLTISTATFAQTTNSSFDDIVNAARANMDKSKLDFDNYAKAVTEEYERYEKAVMEEYKVHCEKVKSQWGDDDIVESGAKSWVEYNDDQSERSVVDFEKGTAKVELLVDVDDLDNQALIDQKMEGAIEQLLSSQGKSLNYNSKYQKSMALSDEPILNQQIDLSEFGISSQPTASVTPPAPKTPAAPLAPPAPKASSTASLPQRNSGSSSSKSLAALDREKSKPKKEDKKEAKKNTPPAPVKPAVAPKPTVTTPKAEVTTPAKPVIAAKPVAPAKPATTTPKVETKVDITPQNVVKVAETIVKKLTPTTTIKENGDGKKVAVVTLDLKLAEDQVSTRAAKFKDIVNKYSKKFDVEAAIIYSIMEQESSFNPAAKSWVPAYGLMQLVPTSGGRDAYNYVYKKDIIPTADYLFDSNNNVELGTAYLKRVRVGYFGKVTDKKCQLLCVIASYNCGAGNVSRAIIGTTNLPKAIPLINKMSYDELYAKLKANLPDETKDYIYKVTRNLNKYSAGRY